MDNENKYLLGAYQKKSFDLFNQVIALEARNQQFAEAIDLQQKKIQELNNRVNDLTVHVQEREDQLKNLKQPRGRKKVTPAKEDVADAGEF
jgi:FtsZ-binding cell division protein ZapB